VYLFPGILRLGLGLLLRPCGIFGLVCLLLCRVSSLCSLCGLFISNADRVAFATASAAACGSFAHFSAPGAGFCASTTAGNGIGGDKAAGADKPSDAQAGKEFFQILAFHGFSSGLE
jgi:hypothetical protein